MSKKVIVRPENPAEFIFVEMPQICWCAGSHIPVLKTMAATVLSAVEANMNCFQFFLGSPQSFNRKKLEYDDILLAKRLSESYGLAVYSHAPYVFNLNGSAKSLCWNGDAAQDGKTRGLLKSLEYELSILSNFSTNGVIIHPGSYADREKGMETIAETINKIKFAENSMLLLENCAGEGNKIPRNFSEIKYILTRIQNRKNVGICLDTAHIHGQGDYDLSKVSEVERMFEEFDTVVGLQNLKLIHLNDSKVKLGAKRDAHELIAEGDIWGSDQSALLRLLKICKDKHIPTILETIPEDMSKIQEFSLVLQDN